MLLSAHLERLATDAIQAALDVDAPARLGPAKDPQHGDYQVNGVLPLAKQLKKNPRELAGPVAARLAAHPEIERAEVAGPGFINLHLSPAWLATQLCAQLADTEGDGVPAVEHSETIVVDFSSPNIAKQMHVGHLRSTIIGDAISRLLSFVGHRVIRDNHIGDWGTQFGLLIVGMRAFGDEQALGDDPIEELERIYKLASARAKEDEAFAEQARAELAKLQQGDAENRRLWAHFVEATRKGLDRAYARMDIHFDEWLGESAYQDRLAGVVETLIERGIAREDQGAMCVFFEDDEELSKNKTPFIVRKKDGAFLYSTTDIATVQYRREAFSANRAVYVVDRRQALHFKQLFAVMRKLGEDMTLHHVGFGTVLGTDGKPLKTRDGEVIKLSSLLDEATERALTRIEEGEIEHDAEDLPKVAQMVGIGAVKYADLRQNRTSDYVFDWDKLVSFKGNAGPYLQYAHARVQAIFRRGEIDPASLSGTTLSLSHPAELALGKQLLRFADLVHAAAESYQPHLVCDHLYALSREFSAFFEQCPVLKSEGAQRQVRLSLCWLTARQLRRGLGLLGIAAPDRM